MSEKDFINVDESQLTLPRQENGDLPVITFMHPVANGPLLEAGEDVGFKFEGAKPALGAFEK